MREMQIPFSLQREDTEAVATVTLDEQTAKSVAETVEKDYYDILKDGTESYEADGTEKISEYRAEYDGSEAEEAVRY